ncbi:MAG: ImmA/IrrE family metallo-endopeptidase [Candidatus Neomarinimicrobiota bacterium]
MKVKDRIQQLHKDIEKFVENGEYENYLKFLSKFWSRSAYNQALIYIFKEHASFVMGYKQWIEKFNRIPVACTVCRSQKNKDCTCKERKAPIRIPQLAPIPYKNKDDEDKIWFKEVYVFDVADTEPIEGLPIKPLEKIAKPLIGQLDNFKTLESALIEIINENGFSFRYDVWDSEYLNGWCNYTLKEIVVHDDRAESQKIKTMIHEIGHMFAHDTEKLGDMKKPRGSVEAEAESIAYVVASHYGLDTSNYSIGYVAGWTGGGDEDTLQDTIQTVSKNAKMIIDMLGGKIDSSSITND